jgi:hypothetical protein
MPMETGPNFKTHAHYWPRNELVLTQPGRTLASQDDRNGAWPELWKYRRLTLPYRSMEGLLVIRQNHWSGGTHPRCLPRGFSELAVFDALVDIRVRRSDEPS